MYPTGVSDTVIQLCNSEQTIASALAKNAKEACHLVWALLYPRPFVLKRVVNRFTIKHDLYYGRGDPTEEDLDRAARCGKFPYRPSDLFLKVRAGVQSCCPLFSLLIRFMANPNLGLFGRPTMPRARSASRRVLSTLARNKRRDASIHNFSVRNFRCFTGRLEDLSLLIRCRRSLLPNPVCSIPDIMQHYYDCIIRAEREVILATNYWQPSNSVDKITSGLIELNRRAGLRGQKNLPVKIMWDRGTFSQLTDNHAMVDQPGREELKLPKLDEIPNLTLEVIVSCKFLNIFCDKD